MTTNAGGSVREKARQPRGELLIFVEVFVDRESRKADGTYQRITWIVKDFPTSWGSTSEFLLTVQESLK